MVIDKTSRHALSIGLRVGPHALFEAPRVAFQRFVLAGHFAAQRRDVNRPLEPGEENVFHNRVPNNGPGEL